MNMTENTPENQLTRYGKIIYDKNPSIVGGLPTRIKPKSKNQRSAYMVSPDTGEVLGKGAFAFVEEEEVDSEEFGKVYLAGIKKFAELSQSGATLFEFVYHEILGINGKDKDTLALNFIRVTRWKPGISKRTFERGLSELIEKCVLFRSIDADIYFINVRFLFNGSRIVLMKNYNLKEDNKNE
jgi:hypothetical protein